MVAVSADQDRLGLIAIEAVGRACAEVAADLPTLPDIVDHGRNGVLFELGIAAALADCLQQQLDTEQLRCGLARAGRESVLQKFDWNEAADRYRQIFASLT